MGGYQPIIIYEDIPDAAVSYFLNMRVSLKA